MPNDILTPLIFTLLYLLSTLNDTISNTLIGITKVNIFLILMLSSWLSSFIFNVFGMNFYIVLFIMILGQWLLFYYLSKKKIDKIKEKLVDVDSIFKNKIGVIKHHVNGPYYLGVIEKDGIIQDILVYSDKILEDNCNFVITGIDGSKILAEKYNNGTKFAQITKK